MTNVWRFCMGLFYSIIPFYGWYLLYQSFKRVKSDEIALFQDAVGNTELLESGIYFRPFPGDEFTESYSKASPYIDFGPMQRVRINQGQVAFKTLPNGALQELQPGIHIINVAGNETFSSQNIRSNQEDYLDFGAKKIVRIRPGKLGVKTDSDGKYVELQPGLHIIDSAMGETFDVKTGIQDIGQDDFTLGNHRYITIRNGELGESYKEGIFVLLEAGRHKLPANHRFIKKVPVDSDVIDLGALKIVTVKEGQVAVINTPEGVVVKGPGKHEIKQSEGNYFNAILTTSPQGVNLPTLTVMCSDQIEMRAESMLTFKVDEPLKTVGLGIERIIQYLKSIADGTLRTILSRFSSTDIAPSLHTDEDHHTTKRNEKLTQLHDECVEKLDEKAKEWGLHVTDLQITEILPADDEYLKTIRNLGSQQSTAEANRRIAENEANIAQIKAKAEESKVIAAEIERREAKVKAETEALTITIQAEAQARQVEIQARAQANATQITSDADAARIKKLSDAAKDASPITQKVMLLEAQGEILKQVKNPVFVQPGLGETSIFSKDKDQGVTFFTTKKDGQSSLVDALLLSSSSNKMLSA